jgi:hypothetical protein
MSTNPIQNNDPGFRISEVIYNPFELIFQRQKYFTRLYIYYLAAGGVGIPAIHAKGDPSGHILHGFSTEAGLCASANRQPPINRRNIGSPRENKDPDIVNFMPSFWIW